MDKKDKTIYVRIVNDDKKPFLDLQLPQIETIGFRKIRFSMLTFKKKRKQTRSNSFVQYLFEFLDLKSNTRR